ncbi:MAG: hypothetical protein ACNA8H_09065, partial [Anaerolineales bacterium]
MNKIKFFSTLLILSLTFSFTVASISKLQFQAYAQDGNGYEVVFTISDGEDGMYYEGAGIPEMLTWGPAAFTVAPDGSFWIADTAAARLLHYSPTGNLLGKIDLKSLIVGATDVEVAESGIWVLDQASIPPKVMSFAEDGTVLA